MCAYFPSVLHAWSWIFDPPLGQKSRRRRAPDTIMEGPKNFLLSGLVRRPAMLRINDASSCEHGGCIVRAIRRNGLTLIQQAELPSSRPTPPSRSKQLLFDFVLGTVHSLAWVSLSWLWFPLFFFFLVDGPYSSCTKLDGGDEMARLLKQARLGLGNLSGARILLVHTWLRRSLCRSSTQA